ncbi:Putative protein in type-1 retrotransposable element R1DM [Araneus ventricosus]|uniref:Endonuclease/exonuclease/phosphatase domain-containing protein n=1 Tax=Araneus ventricosus TaxID=182803 RepID=A0A4Y2NJZ9_ARAVE|nr:Putative protein in type-1 retrotransposable element R1DM [Araneus ventricosus]
MDNSIFENAQFPYNIATESSNQPLKILQINLARAKAATNQLHLTARTNKPDVILVQEQYVNNNEIPGIRQTWKTFSSSNQKAAILIPSFKLKLALSATKVNMIALKIQTSLFPITIITVYSSPAQNVPTALQSNDNRGKDILGIILANKLNIINKPDALPTFQRNNSVGWLDLTLCSQSIIDSSINCEVLEEISLSDHRYIETTIASTVANKFYKRYKTRHGNHLRFLNNLGKEIYHLERKIKAVRNSGELNNATIELQTLIINSCNKSFKIKKQLLITKPNWWTEQLEIHKKKVRALRRRAQLVSEIERQARYQVFKKEKAKYKRHIKQASNMGWRKFCSAASHPYGKQYKAAFRKLVFPSQIPYLINGDPNGNLQEAAQNILHQIFLSLAIPTNYNLTTSTQTPYPPFSPQEISAVIEHIPSGKAPGIDGIDNLLIKIIHKRFNNIFPTLFNNYLRISFFPDSLKIGNIILFQKGGKDQRLSSSYRPISLSPTIGKVLEKLMTQRLTYHLESTNSLNNRQ